MRTTQHRADHPNPTPAPPMVEARPDEYVFAAEYHFDAAEERVHALSEHFGAGVMS